MVMNMYGIPNCDTIKKARIWLSDNNIDYTFHDYKKEGVDRKQLTTWCKALGWETLLNKRGTTWRKVPDDQKASINETSAIDLMIENPSMIKRPVLTSDNLCLVGFSADEYAAKLS